MRPKLLTLALPVLATLWLTGCQLWNPGGTSYTGQDGAFTVRTPANWMYATRLGNDLLATKDGPILQQIIIEHHDLKEALPHSNRTLTANLAPYEVAEAVTDNLRADHSLLGLEIQENVPVDVGGRPGFKLVFSFRTEEKLRLSEQCYGCLAGGRLWLLRYRAPSRHYFARDQADFETMVKDFQFGRL
jgi:hypothetical protein